MTHTCQEELPNFPFEFYSQYKATTQALRSVLEIESRVSSSKHTVLELWSSNPRHKVLEFLLVLPPCAGMGLTGAPPCPTSSTYSTTPSTGNNSRSKTGGETAHTGTSKTNRPVQLHYITIIVEILVRANFGFPYQRSKNPISLVFM